jgi:hypothetical protein
VASQVRQGIGREGRKGFILDKFLDLSLPNPLPEPWKTDLAGCGRGRSRLARRRMDSLRRAWRGESRGEPQ